MRHFAALYSDIDGTTSTNRKVDAMAAYFASAEPADAAWAIYFLSGGRPKRLIPIRRIATWAMEQANVPDWLFEECHHAVGDLAETIALLLPIVAPSESVILSPSTSLRDRLTILTVPSAPLRNTAFLSGAEGNNFYYSGP